MKIRLALVLALFTAACVEQPDVQRAGQCVEDTIGCLQEGPGDRTLSDDLDLPARESYTLEQSTMFAADDTDDALERVSCSSDGVLCCTDDLTFCCFFGRGPALCA